MQMSFKFFKNSITVAILFADIPTKLHCVAKRMVLKFGKLQNHNRFIIFLMNGKKTKFPTKPVWKFPSHLNDVATLPCEMQNSLLLHVNHMFHSVPNDQQKLLQFSNILNTQVADMPLMIPQIVYATGLRSGLFDLLT